MVLISTISCERTTLSTNTNTKSNTSPLHCQDVFRVLRIQERPLCWLRSSVPTQGQEGEGRWGGAGPEQRAHHPRHRHRGGMFRCSLAKIFLPDVVRRVAPPAPHRPGGDVHVWSSRAGIPPAQTEGERGGRGTPGTSPGHRRGRPGQGEDDSTHQNSGCKSYFSIIIIIIIIITVRARYLESDLGWAMPFLQYSRRKAGEPSGTSCQSTLWASSSSSSTPP